MVEYTKRILCLANSRKISGRCIAGLEIANGAAAEWIRPVSRRENSELSERDRNFDNGRDPQVLDVIDVPMLGRKDHNFQIENHLIDDGYYFQFVARATFEQVNELVDRTGRSLWSNISSSYSGTRDRISEDSINPKDGSLRLIQVNDLEVTTSIEGAAFNNAKRKVRGLFTFNGLQYCLSVTDPIVEREGLARNNGTYHIGNAILCISLGEIYQGYTYKLIASVITE